jgi:hypothetical protein
LLAIADALTAFGAGVPAAQAQQQQRLGQLRSLRADFERQGLQQQAQAQQAFQNLRNLRADELAQDNFNLNERRISILEGDVARRISESFRPDFKVVGNNLFRLNPDGSFESVFEAKQKDQLRVAGNNVIRLTSDGKVEVLPLPTKPNFAVSVSDNRLVIVDKNTGKVVRDSRTTTAGGADPVRARQVQKAVSDIQADAASAEVVTAKLRALAEKILSGEDPIVNSRQYLKTLQSNATLLARAKGEKGVVTDLDVERQIRAFPGVAVLNAGDPLGDSLSLIDSYIDDLNQITERKIKAAGGREENGKKNGEKEKYGGIVYE